MTTQSAAAEGTRLTKDERREQLLDVASDLIVDRGVAALTMEGLAAAGGVSKALPYRHFPNAEAVLVALYQREVAQFGPRILAAIDGLTDDDEIVRASIHAYLDIVDERGRILAVFYGPGSPIPEHTREGTRASLAFTANLLERAFGVCGTKATVLAGVTLGVLYSSIDMWAQGIASRATIEDVAVRSVVAAGRAAVAT